MTNTQIRKRHLEEKLGSNRNDIIKKGFDKETIGIVWDIVNHKYESLREHPLIAQDEPTWPDWVFFLVVHNTHASIWAIEKKHLTKIDMIDQDYLTFYDVNNCIKPDSTAHRFHVVLRQDDRYYVETDELNFLGKKAEYDKSLYVGTLTLSLRGIKVLMAMIARHYLLLQSDSLGYCKDFVMIYFDLIEEEVSPEYLKVLERLTVTTNALSAVSERAGRQNPKSGWSLRTVLTSTFAQTYFGIMLAGVTLYLLNQVLKK